MERSLGENKRILGGAHNETGIVDRRNSTVANWTNATNATNGTNRTSDACYISDVGSSEEPPVKNELQVIGAFMAVFASSSGNFGTTGLGNTGPSGNYENFRPSTSGVTTGHGHSLSLSQTHSLGGSNGIRPGTVGANVYNSQIPLSSNKSSSGNSNTHSHSHSKSNSKSNNPNHVVASTRGMMRYRRTRSSTAENGGGGSSAMPKSLRAVPSV